MKSLLEQTDCVMFNSLGQGARIGDFVKYDDNIYTYKLLSTIDDGKSINYQQYTYGKPTLTVNTATIEHGFGKRWILANDFVPSKN